MGRLRVADRHSVSRACLGLNPLLVAVREPVGAHEGRRQRQGNPSVRIARAKGYDTCRRNGCEAKVLVLEVALDTVHGDQPSTSMTDRIPPYTILLGIRPHPGGYGGMRFDPWRCEGKVKKCR